jgi:hypothetical protein
MHTNAYFVLFLWVMSEASASTDQVSALALAPFSNGDSSIMKYEGYLKPWAVARLLPTLQWAIIGRYRSRMRRDIFSCFGNEYPTSDLKWCLIYPLAEDNFFEGGFLIS